MFNEDAATVAQIFADKLTGLDPKGMLQSITHTSGGMFGVLAIVISLFRLCYLCCIKPNQENLNLIWMKLLTLKINKGKTCGNSDMV